MKTKKFRVAVEGATTDGRTIERNWLQEMAETYNRDTYAARVNLEHIRGVTADGPFQAYGDVISLSTEEVTLELGGKQEKRLALMAEIDALDPLVAMNQKRQKLYSSVEIQPNFANSGKAYLVGLAVTDSPASLGTEMLQFAAQLVQAGKESPLAARKQDKANLFSAAQEITLEFAEEQQEQNTGLLASIKAALDKFTAAAPAPAAPPVAPAAPAEPKAEPDAQFAAQFATLGEAMTAMVSGIEALSKSTGEQITRLSAELGTLKETVEKIPAPGFTQRPLSTGGSGSIKTDC